MMVGKTKKGGSLNSLKGKGKHCYQLHLLKKVVWFGIACPVTFKAKNRLSENDDLLLDVEKDSDLLWNIQKLQKYLAKYC